MDDHAQLTDALARGRLAPAEIAAIPPRELEALFETAARCLDASRDTEAVHLLGGLVTLFPFSARYWRAYAIALHRRLEIDRARAAYEASLALEPDHELTRCYRCEILIYLGRAAEAAEELRELAEADDRVAAERASELLRQLDALSTWRPPPPEPEERTQPAADRPRFVLEGDRELPLEPSRFEDEEALEPTLVRDEITRTARIFAPISNDLTAPLENPLQEITDTAIMRRRGETEPGVLNENSVTGTALLPGRKGRPAADVPERSEGSTTALLPGRKGRPPAPAPAEGSATALMPGRKGRPPAPEAEEAPEGLGVVSVPWDAGATDTEVRGIRPEPLRPGGPVATPVGVSPEPEESSEEPTRTDVQSSEEPTHTDLLNPDDSFDDEPTHTAVVLRRDGALSFDREEE